MSKFSRSRFRHKYHPFPLSLFTEYLSSINIFYMKLLYFFFFQLIFCWPSLYTVGHNLVEDSKEKAVHIPVEPSVASPVELSNPQLSIPLIVGSTYFVDYTLYNLATRLTPLSSSRVLSWTSAARSAMSFHLCKRPSTA